MVTVKLLYLNISPLNFAVSDSKSFCYLILWILHFMLASRDYSATNVCALFNFAVFERPQKNEINSQRKFIVLQYYALLKNWLYNILSRSRWGGLFEVM